MLTFLLYNENLSKNLTAKRGPMMSLAAQTVTDSVPGTTSILDQFQFTLDSTDP